MAAAPTDWRQDDSLERSNDRRVGTINCCHCEACYCRAVVTLSRTYRSATIILFAFALPLSGCANWQNRRANLDLAVPSIARSPGTHGDWWLDAGDPLLAQLIDQGLASSAALVCEAAALTNKRLHRDKADMIEAGYRHADHRARTAAAIAHAYVDVRRWQSLLALRRKILGQYRDNAEIARFRREAGLVSAIDGGLAGALSTLDGQARERTNARLETAVLALANLTGMAAADLRMKMGGGTALPDLAPPPIATPSDLSARADLLALKIRLERRLLRERVSQAALDRAATDTIAASPISPAQVALAVWRRAWASAEMEVQTLSAALAATDTGLQTLPRRQAATQQTVGDARLAYRMGVGDFANLFVAEIAALGLQEAQVEARADRDVTIIDLRTALGEGWIMADLEPVPARGRGADCE